MVATGLFIIGLGGICQKFALRAFQKPDRRRRDMESCSGEKDRKLMTTTLWKQKESGLSTEAAWVSRTARIQFERATELHVRRPMIRRRHRKYWSPERRLR